MIYFYIITVSKFDLYMYFPELMHPANMYLRPPCTDEEELFDTHFVLSENGLVS